MAWAAFVWNIVPSWVFTLWSFKLVPPTTFSEHQGLFSPLSIYWPFPFGFIYLTLQLFWLSRLFLWLRGCFPRGGPFDVFQDSCHNRLNFTCYPWNLPLPAAAIVKNGRTQNSATSRGKKSSLQWVHKSGRIGISRWLPDFMSRLRTQPPSMRTQWITQSGHADEEHWDIL